MISISLVSDSVPTMWVQKREARFEVFMKKAEKTTSIKIRVSEEKLSQWKDVAWTYRCLSLSDFIREAVEKHIENTYAAELPGYQRKLFMRLRREAQEREARIAQLRAMDVEHLVKNQGGPDYE